MTVIRTTPAQRETLRQRMAELLASGDVARIRFRYGRFTLRPGGYTVIATSLLTRTIHHEGERRTRRPMDVRVERMPRHVGALYEARSNTIVVPSVDFGQTDADRAALVHEATHAIFDYERVPLTAFEEEACAYIADAMYQRITYQSLPTGSSAIRQEAWRIAQDLVAPHRLMAAWSDEVSAADMRTLIATIRTSPTYRELAARRADYVYEHDGGTI
jgi:hypothetical protein